jgi:inner membrane protein
VATLITHALVATSAWTAFRNCERPRRLLGLGVLAAMAPDVDVVGLWLGIPYEAMAGHRGITHSLAFAAALAWIFARWVRAPTDDARQRRRALLYLFLATASHGLLDAMTNGGLGVAFFAPFSAARFYLPWRPIWVSPMGLCAFFTLSGREAIFSEVMWLWGPAELFAIVAWLQTRRRRTDDGRVRSDGGIPRG